MTLWISVVGWALVHFVWQGTLIALVTATSLALARHASARLRYAIACAGLCGMIAIAGVTVVRLADDTSIPNVAAAPDLATSLDTLAAETGVFVTSVTTSRAVDVASARNRVDAMLPLVVALWLAGVGVLLVRLARGWWWLRRLRRDLVTGLASRWQSTTDRLGSALGIDRLVRVVDSHLVDSPMVIGWLRPAIVLPVAALTNLTSAQVEAILAHELAHVRRHDFLINLLQTGAETVLFYHPAVWWISRRIRAEREHCCDAIAVDLCGDPVEYATALTELETWRATRTSLAVAATDGALLDRIRRVLGVHRTDAPRSIGAPVLIAALGVLFAMTIGTRYLPAAEPASDDVVSTQGASRPSDDGGPPWKMIYSAADGVMRFNGVTARELIRFAYQLHDPRILGGPAWIGNQPFDLSVTLAAAPGADDMQALVRDVLSSRFRLATHEETRNFPVYALVMAKSDGSWGPNLQPATTECLDADSSPAVPRSASRSRTQRRCGEDIGEFFARTLLRASMTQFAESLRSPLRRPIVDRTGLTGEFDIHLDLSGGRYFGTALGLNVRAGGQYERRWLQDINVALEEQLGLQLVESTAPSDVLVIDSAARPTSN